MSEEKFLFRNVFNIKVVTKQADRIENVWHLFPKQKFIEEINDQLENLQYGERLQLITLSLKKYLPDDYLQALKILVESLPTELQQSNLTGFDGFIIMPMTLFVSKYGLEYFKESMEALYEMTKRFSAESDIRIFIEKYPEQSLELLQKWSLDSNTHVRRLVSEGTRPRLPLGRRLKMFQTNPAPVLKLLENLKDDPQLYVRRSVANNLNDIAKDNPQAVVDTLLRWQVDITPQRQWLIKHALRTLLKVGNPQALQILGFEPVKVEIKNLLVPNYVNFGEKLKFSFDLISLSENEQKVMVDYAIHFQKSRGILVKKVFKLTSKILLPKQSLSIKKEHLFANFTTRKHYGGLHKIEIIVNGLSSEIQDFELMMVKYN